MHNFSLPTSAQIDEKVNHYYSLYKSQGKNYTKDQIKKGTDYLSYKEAMQMPKKESDIKPTIYIFRHGQTTDNAEFIYSGWRDSKLTKKGEEQAEELAYRLKDKKIQMLISSPQTRALETMKIVVSKNDYAKNLRILTDKRIMERSYGDLQGKNKLDLYLEDPKKLEEIRRSFTTQPANGESIKMVCERVKDFCDEITKLMKEHNVNVAVSCHGNSIRGFRRYFEHLSDDETAHLETPLGQDYLAYVIE